MFVSCWEGIENTPFTKVKLIERDPKKKKRTVKYLYLHRITKQIFNENPLQPVKEEITQVKQLNEEKEKEEDIGNIEIAEEGQE